MSRVIKFRAFTDGKMIYDIDISNTGQMIEGGYIVDCPVMQFTGLYDKDGKEIYEGDIVFLSHWKSSDLFDYSRPFLVKWESGQINFKQEEYNNFIGSLNGKLKIEIIGNIHQNPELL